MSEAVRSDDAQVIAILGPTGTGKSDFAILIAQWAAERGRDVEIVNADAMQLYRGMDIGTAKLGVAERRGIAHHLFDVLDVTDEASVADFQTEARRTISDIIDRGNTPILVGGSGLYLQATLDDFRFPGTDPAYRAAREAELEQHGPGPLWRELNERDPRAAERVGPHNGRRIVRALEIIHLTGEPFSATLPEVPTPWIHALRLGFRIDSPSLATRLDARVHQMWANGLCDEVEGLLALGLRDGKTASRAIGYAQATAQLDGELSEAEAIEQTQALTRRYARRQRSWFGRDDRITWLDGTDSAVRRTVPDAVRSLLG
ncbi:MAG: tRNA (adenosine(37)-N6)-dimethylallyltransferase MiaA [Mycetocola sp.]